MNKASKTLNLKQYKLTYTKKNVASTHIFLSSICHDFISRIINKLSYLSLHSELADSINNCNLLFFK